MSAKRKNIRETVRKASYKSEASSRLQIQGEGSPGRQSLGHQSPKDSASRSGSGMSAQLEVVQNTSPGEGVFTERVPSPIPICLSSPASSPVSSPVPLQAPLPIPSPVASPVASLVASVVASVVAPPVALLVASQVASPVYSSNPITLLAEAIEWDLLDCSGIPALIGGVLRGTNVNEFLERLEVLAYTGRRSFIAVDFSSRNIPDIGKTTIHESNGNLFTSMIRQVFDKHTRLAIQVAYEVFWNSGEIQSFR